MLNTIDIKTAFQAVPEMARYPATEQGGMMYRQVRELQDAREQENTRAHTVPETRHKENPVFAPIKFPDDESGSRHRGSSRKQQEREERLTEPYRPVGHTRRTFLHARREEALGESLDLTA